MPPVKTLEMLGFTGGVDMADIGCGIGYFSIPAAEIAGPSSKIYALDISIEMLDEVEKRALETGLSNIHNIMVDEYDLKLSDQSVGFAILCNVLHEIEDKNRYLSEICRILQDGGSLQLLNGKKSKENRDHLLNIEFHMRRFLSCFLRMDLKIL
jgi:ubiquinone/menaquinone biosynthesis C-methylase UbiE